MAHKFRLKPMPFLNIKRRTKRFEVRLYSPTRRKIKRGDDIVFFHNDEFITRKVKNILVFKSFEHCFDVLDINFTLPSLSNKTKKNAIMHYHSIYPIEKKRKRWGVVVFELI